MFDFNYHSSLLLLGCLQAAVYGGLLGLRYRREERPHDLLGALILLVTGLYAAQWMLGFAGWYADDGRKTFMYYLEWNNLIALGPLVWLYFRAATNTDFRWRRRYWLHFLPLALTLVPPLVKLFYDWVIWRGLAGEAFTFDGGRRGPAAEWYDGQIGPFLAVEDALSRVSIIAYLVATVGEYRAYRNYLSAEFTNPERYYLSTLRNLLYLLIVGTGVHLLIEVVEVSFGLASYEDVWGRYFGVSVITYFSAILFHKLSPARLRSLRYDPVNEPETLAATPTEPEPRRVAEPLPAEKIVGAAADISPEYVALARRLEERFASHRDYLDPELKLGTLAARLNTNAGTLSRAINQYYGVNFNDFINRRRCEVFLERVKAGEHERHTLLSLALDSGFNSKSTFNRAFRKQYGRSPGEALRLRRFKS